MSLFSTADVMLSAMSRWLRRLGELTETSRFILVLVGVWLVYVFHSYLPALAADLVMRELDQYLRRSGTYDVLLVLWFAAVAYCAGERLLHLLGVSAARGAEQVVFSFATGSVLFSLVSTILGLVHGLYRPAAYALLLIPSVLWRAEMATLPGKVRRAIIAMLKEMSWSPRSLGFGFAGAYIVVVLVVVLLSALAPSFDYDDLTYHLAGPKNFVLHHRLVPLFDVPHSSFPKNIEMVFTLALLWHCDVTAKLVHFLFGIVAMLAVYGFSVRFLSRSTGVVAVAILVSSPLFIWEMRTANNDIGLALFVFLGVYALALWLWSGEAPWLRLAIVSLAFSLGIKYWAVLALGVAVFLVFAVRLYQSRALLAAAGSAAKLALFCCLGLLPWSLVNLHYTGNPLFPVLNDVFPSPYWTSAHTDMALSQWHGGGIRITASRWWELFGFWWKTMVDPRGLSGGNIGPFYVMLLPLLLLSPGVGRELWFVFASSALYYVGWVTTGPWMRFLLPALPGFALAAACGAVGWLRLLGSLRMALAVAGVVLLGAFAVLSTPFFESYGASARYGYGLIQTLPVRYLIGQESKSDYLNRHHPGYRSVQFLNRLPGRKKVYYEAALPDGFYLDGLASHHYSPFAPALRDLKADDLHRVLRENGVTHLVVEQFRRHVEALSSRESEFTRRYLRKLYQRNTHIVYELLPAAVAQESVMIDFLDHLQDAYPEGSRPLRQVRRIFDDARYAMVTTPPAEVEFTVHIDQPAALSFAVGKSNPACTQKGTFQVWIQSQKEGRRIVYRRELEGESGAGWFEDRVDLSEYAGQRTSIVFKTEDPSGCCDYLWADPVLIARTSDSWSRVANGGPSAHPRLVVSGGSVVPAEVRVGESFELKFLGPALPRGVYIDVRFWAPGRLVEQVAFNWQQGTSARHTVDPGIPPGRWVITGVRAHRERFDHEGEFNPVWIVLEVHP